MEEEGGEISAAGWLESGQLLALWLHDCWETSSNVVITILLGPLFCFSFVFCHLFANQQSGFCSEMLLL